jgi:hypothetical protein
MDNVILPHALRMFNSSHRVMWKKGEFFKLKIKYVMQAMFKIHPVTGHERTEWEYRYSSTLFLTSALDGGGWSMPRPSRFTPGKDPVHFVYEAGWTPGPVRTGAENLALTWIRSRTVQPVAIRCTD